MQNIQDEDRFLLNCKSPTPIGLTSDRALPAKKFVSCQPLHYMPYNLFENLLDFEKKRKNYRKSLEMQKVPRYEQ